MRLPRLKPIAPSAIYNVVTHSADLFFNHKMLQASVRETFRLATFMGLEILDYAFMSNHLHIVVHVSQDNIPDNQELVNRVKAFYPENHPTRKIICEQWETMGYISKDLRDKLLARMNNISRFMQELKQNLSRMYNRMRDRNGPVWRERFKASIVQKDPDIVVTLSYYNALNAFRAGLVRDPKDYPFCGYAAAVAGDPVMRNVYLKYMRFREGQSWEEFIEEYQRKLFSDGAMPKRTGQAAMDPEALEKLFLEDGTLSPEDILRHRVRYFSENGVIGSQAFVQEIFCANRACFSRTSKGALWVKIRIWPELRVIRNLRRPIFGYKKRKMRKGAEENRPG